MTDDSIKAALEEENRLAAAETEGAETREEQKETDAAEPENVGEEQPEEEQMCVLYHILIKPFVETDPLCVWSDKFKPEKERYNE